MHQFVQLKMYKMLFNTIKSRTWKSHVLLKAMSLLLLGIFMIPCGLNAQDDATDKEVVDKPVRSVFESALLIDNQSVLVPSKGTFEFDIQHRFGTMNNGYDDLWGLYASSNIRLGFGYAPIENLYVGVGLTKFKHLIDLNAKYSILKQTRSGAIPVFVTYYGNMAFDTRSEDRREEVFHSSDRISYFHQVIIGRKFNKWLSVQVAPSVSHYNIVDDSRDHDHFAVAFGAQVKATDALHLLVNVDQPITQHPFNNPNPNVSFGIQMATSSHAFQIFIANSSRILPQETNVFNNKNFSDNFGENFLIGFNITRLWSL